jgi:transposase InsO family protein
MSRKGKSGDNAPLVGFFGRLKQMWFNRNNFDGYGYTRFCKELDAFLQDYKKDKQLLANVEKTSMIKCT